MNKTQLANYFDHTFLKPYAAREDMERLADACTFTYKERGIGRAAAADLYGAVLNGSVTRLEGYAACAYAHFLNHGLELKKLREYELDLSDMGNLHIHADLIAGLPYEDFHSFGRSFDAVYGSCDVLQLGFLKLIYGSALREKIKDYGFVFSRKKCIFTQSQI